MARSTSGIESAGDCWDLVGTTWSSRRDHALWREYTDRLQTALLDRSLGGLVWPSNGSQLSVLKTDLFDEIAGKGIVGHLATLGFHVTGIDISPVVVQTASDRNPEMAAIVADVRDLCFPDESFDVVFSGSTLDHFETTADIGRAVREIARVLRPKGVLVLTLDNPRNPLVWLRNGRLQRLLRGCGIVPYPVGATLGPDALTEVVRAGGLEVLRLSAILHCPRVLAVWFAHLLQNRSPETQARFLDALSRWEWLERWPSRWMTGYFTAILAAKPDAPDPTPSNTSRP